MIFGRLAHAYVLEGREAWICAPEGLDRRTKEGKAWSAEHADATVVSREDDARLRDMRAMLERHPAVMDLLGGCAFEAGLFWERDGLKLKQRCDAIYYGQDGEETYVVEYKTTQDARAREFGKDAGKFLYHAQLAWYCDGVAATQKLERDTVRAYIIAQEKDAPHAIAVYAVDRCSLASGRDVYEKALDIYRECTEKNEWPAYAPGIAPLEIPAWAYEAAHR